MAQPEREPAGTPRWVKMFGIAAVVLALLLVLVASGVGGPHGPGRHLAPHEASNPSRGGTGDRALPEGGRP